MSGLLSYARNVRERLAPLRTSSAFEERGVLTAEEFVRAGDNLVGLCPTWRWEGGDPSRAKPYLPRDKQYLVTRGAPCLRRIKALMEGEELEEEVLIEGAGEDPWIQASGGVHRESGGANALPDLDADKDRVVLEGDDARKEAAPAVNANLLDGHFEVDREASSSYPDLESFEEDNIVGGEDAASLPPAAYSSRPRAAAATATPYLKAEEPPCEDENILQLRRYDLSITYDKYYQTPRMWLMGYGEDGVPLSAEAMFEDIMDDYAHQTVTVEVHPHESSHHASIHPCKHAHVMKRMIDRLADAGRPSSVEQYIFIFLKLLQSVVPTINYDFTVAS